MQPPQSTGYLAGKSFGQFFFSRKIKSVHIVTGVIVIFALAGWYSIYTAINTPSPQITQATAVPPQPELDCVKDEVKILELVNSKITNIPSATLRVLKLCASTTNNPNYITKLAEVEKIEKAHAVIEKARIAKLQKEADIEAKKEAKLKKSRGVQIGMSAEDVIASSWGKPQSVNTTTTARGSREQWVYGNRSYLYFVDKTLTTIQN